MRGEMALFLDWGREMREKATKIDASFRRRLQRTALSGPLALHIESSGLRVPG